MTDSTIEAPPHDPDAGQDRDDVSDLIRGSLRTRVKENLRLAFVGNTGVPSRIALNIALTTIVGLLLAYGIYRGLLYIFATGRWEVISDNLQSFMVGIQWRRSGREFWMLWAAIYSLGALISWIVGDARRSGDAAPASRSDIFQVLLAPVVGLTLILLMVETLTPVLLVLGLIPLYFVVRTVAEHVPAIVARHSGLIYIALVVSTWWWLVGIDPQRRTIALVAVAAWAAVALIDAIVDARGSASVTRWVVPVTGILRTLLLAVSVVLLLAAGRTETVEQFGGVLLTVVVAFVAITLSFPIGVAAALGRRSSMPVLRAVTTAYIELIRGVPLISILYVAVLVLGQFFFPVGFERPGVVILAVIGFALFTAAYIAEDVRGGLQSVPRGQTEAGQAIGLPPVKITSRIVLPQALRNSIPALIGQFISVLKDTSLLIIIGIRETLGVGDTILSAPTYLAQGYRPEMLAFAGLLYWMMAFSMSRQSERLERRLGLGVR